MARKFFHVCAGLMMLAVSFHLGASFARAQAGMVSAGYLGPARYPVFTLAVVGRQMYVEGRPAGLPIPGAGEVRWMGVGFGDRPAVMLENGDCYLLTGETFPPQPGDVWVSAGNPIPFATEASRESWGQLKSRYAPTRESAQPGATGR